MRVLLRYIEQITNEEPAGWTGRVGWATGLSTDVFDNVVEYKEGASEGTQEDNAALFNHRGQADGSCSGHNTNMLPVEMSLYIILVSIMVLSTLYPMQ